MTINRFVRGGYTLDINADPYAIGDDFNLPGVSPTWDIADGTSANRYGGGTLIGSKYGNQKIVFSVRVEGALSNNMARARELVNFVNGIDNSVDPTYFEHSPHDLPEPLYGQFGARIRLEIVAGHARMWDSYGSEVTRSQAFVVVLNLEIKPIAQGQRQRLAQASGALLVDNIGSETGAAWGLRILEATTNKLQNPVFGHPLWSTGWTIGSGLTATRIGDPKHVYPSSSSGVLLTTNGGANSNITQTVNAGNTNKHVLSVVIATAGGITPTDYEINLSYGGTVQTKNIKSLGDDKFLVYTEPFDGINGNATVSINTTTSIYLLGAQLEEKTYHTPLVHGDMLGCSYSGTAMESSSVAAAGTLKLPVALDTFTPNYWGIHTVWMPDYASTVDGNRYLFSGGTASIEGYFNATDDKFYLVANSAGVDGTVSTSAFTFSPGDVIDFIATAKTGGVSAESYRTLALYVKNLTTGTAFGGTVLVYVPSQPDYIYIGSDSAGANHAGGVFQLFETYGEYLSGAQGTALHTAVAGYSGKKVGDIPWFWTANGDDTLYNCDDSGRNNWGVAGGIPGDYPALTDFRGSVNLSESMERIYLSVNAAPDYYNMSQLYVDVSGTVNNNCSGSAFGWETWYSTPSYSATVSSTSFIKDMLAGEDIYCFFRTAGTASSGTVSTRLRATLAGVEYYSDYYNTTLAGSVVYRLGPVVIPELDSQYWDEYRRFIGSGGSAWADQCVLSLQTGSGDPYHVVGLDYVRFLSGDIRYMTNYMYIPQSNFTMTENSGYILGPYGGISLMNAIGKPLSLEPGMYNHVTHLIFDGLNYYGSYVADTMVLTVEVTPRWGLV